MTSRQLPAELADLAARAALCWPEADEDAMRAQAAAWRAAATETAGLADEAGAAIRPLLAAAPAAARDAGAQLIDTNGGFLREAVLAARHAAQRLEQAATAIGATKDAMIRELERANTEHKADQNAESRDVVNALAERLDALADELIKSVGAAATASDDAMTPPYLRALTDHADPGERRPEPVAPDEAGTGPIVLGGAFGYQGLLHTGGFDQVPTPSAGMRPMPPYTGPVPDHPPPTGPAQRQLVQQARENELARFKVHLFPIGHLPVAAVRPARQLSTTGEIGFGPEQWPVGVVLPIAGGCAATGPTAMPAELTSDYEPLGGFTDQEWRQRYLTTVDNGQSRYRWPPNERFPEGGMAESELVTLAEGIVVDRFGTEHGRIFAPADTAFARRSLPSVALAGGYRRYQVIAALPVWLTTSAPWFGQPGGGTRYRAAYSAVELVAMGYLRQLESPASATATGARGEIGE